MAIEPGKNEALRTGLLVRTAKGREIFLVSRYLTSGGHRGMDYAMREMLAKEVGDGDSVASYLWGGEFRLRRTPDPTKLQVVEINPTSGMMFEGGHKSDSAALEAALKSRFPDIIIDGAAKKFKENGREHLSEGVELVMERIKAKKKEKLAQELAQWESGGKIGPEPKLEPANLRHDMPDAIDVATVGNLLSLWGMGARDRVLTKMDKYFPAIYKLATVLHEDGKRIPNDPIKEPGTAFDHLAVLAEAGRNYERDKTLGVDPKVVFASVKKLQEYIHDDLGPMMDVKDGNYNAAQRALIFGNVQAIQIQGPSALVPLRAGTGP